MKTISVILLSAALAPAGFSLTSCHRQTTAKPELMSVDVAYPTEDSVMIYKTYPGTLKARRTVEIVGRVNGYLLSANYNSGDLVKKGKVLFRIEDTSYRDAVAKAEAALATAEGNLQYAETRYNAMEEALKGDAVSEMEVKEAQSTLVECKAAVKQARASLQQARTTLSYCTVTAPFDGHVSDTKISVGGFVGGEASPVELATIYMDDNMDAVFAIDDDNALGQLRKNIESGLIDYKHIPISFSENLSRPYYGVLSYEAPNIDTSTGTMELKAALANPDYELKSGMYASIKLPYEADPDAILIKDAAIGTDQLGKYVYVVNDSDKVVYTPIKIGDLVRDSLRIVNSGITVKDRYVTKALMKVRDGLEVKPVVVK
ncbi:MAG: efflux RND transporter periplasmic adaptor subunit [Muribaculaceae bacterium]|jgi:RND family efflux transporter MFP subunit|nr:efflux RND transporter periplasmic adaptor subunit [Muribaculaceae bacterium]